MIWVPAKKNALIPLYCLNSNLFYFRYCYIVRLLVRLDHFFAKMTRKWYLIHERSFNVNILNMHCTHKLLHYFVEFNSLAHVDMQIYAFYVDPFYSRIIIIIMIYLHIVWWFGIIYKSLFNPILLFIAVIVVAFYIILLLLFCCCTVYVFVPTHCMF